jgi:hypothetical protein
LILGPWSLILDTRSAIETQLPRSPKPLLPIIITVLLRDILLLFFRTARCAACSTGHNIVTGVRVCHALRLLFCASSRRLNLERIASRRLCESGSAGRSLVRSRLLWSGSLCIFFFLFVVVIPSDVLLVVCSGVCGVLVRYPAPVLIGGQAVPLRISLRFFSSSSIALRMK